MARPVIAVLAGTNGAGKSSIGGALLEQHGVPYFNPDLVAREIRAEHRELSVQEANGLAWAEGLRQLRLAIDVRRDFSFETTLGGETMTRELFRAAANGCDLWVWYGGLATVERHIERVAARVAKGGHSIPERDIRRRFDQSRINLIRLMPELAELKVFDNSAEADPSRKKAPEPRLLLHLKGGRVLGPEAAALARTPDWAKPLVMAALDHAKQVIP